MRRAGGVSSPARRSRIHGNFSPRPSRRPQSRLLASDSAPPVSPACLRRWSRRPATGFSPARSRSPPRGVEISALSRLSRRRRTSSDVLVIHEMFGVHEHIKDVCRRLAKLGYYAIAPELFARQGDASAETDMRKLMADIVAKTPEAEVAERSRRHAGVRRASGKADMKRAARHRLLLGRAGRPGSTPRIIRS